MHFSMLDAKLWYNEKETKNVKVAKMVEFNKTCDQYPCRFKFGNFFSSIIPPPPFPLGKNRSSENAVLEAWVISVAWEIMIKTWGRVLLGGISKKEHFFKIC